MINKYIYIYGLLIVINYELLIIEHRIIISIDDWSSKVLKRYK